MTEARIKAFFTLVTALCAACFFGVGVSYQVGFGVFFFLWSIAGIMELSHD